MTGPHHRHRLLFAPGNASWQTPLILTVILAGILLATWSLCAWAAGIPWLLSLAVGCALAIGCALAAAGIALAARNGSRCCDALQLGFGDIIASSDDAILTKTLDGIITSWNPGAQRLFGYGAAEAIGHPMLMLFPPDLAAEESAILARIGKGERISHFETRRIAKDGRLLDVSVTISPIRDGSGKVVGASKIARDITERKRLETNLRQQAAVLVQSQQAARIGSMEIDCTVTPWRRTWSEETFRLLGFDPATGIPAFELLRSAMHAEDRHHLDATLEAIRAGRQPGEFDFRLADASGGERILHLAPTLTVDPATGKPLRLIGTIQDITERARAEADLRHQADLLKRSQRVARLGSIEVDFTVTPWRRSWSDEMFHLLHLDPRTTSPSREALLAAAHPDDHERIEENYRLAAQGLPFKDLNFRVVAPDGSIQILQALFHFDHEPGTGRLLRSFATFQDVSEQVHAETALRHQADALARSQRLARLGSIEVDYTVTPWRRSWSDEMFRLLHLDPANITPGPDAFIAAVHPDDRVALEERQRKAADGEGFSGHTFRVVGPDGGTRILQGMMQFERDGASGRPLRSFASFQDVTVRVRADLAQSRQSRLLTKAQEMARLGFIEVDYTATPWGRVWSEQTYRLLGLDRATTPSIEAFRAALHADDRPILDVALADLKRGRVPTPIDVRIPGADGSERILHVSSEMDVDPITRAPLTSFNTLQDVTELRRSEEKFRQAIAAAPTGMMMVDRDGKMVLANAQIVTWFGYASQELIGMPVEILVPERFRAQHPRLRAGYGRNPIARPAGQGRELFGRRKDGTEFPVEIGLTPVPTTDGAFVLCSIVDITERKSAEQRLRGQLGRLDLLRRITHAIGQRHDLPSILQVVVESLEDNLTIDLVCCCRHDAADGNLVVTNVGRRCGADALAMGLGVDAVVPIDANGLSRCVADALVYEPDVALVPFPFPRRLAAAGFRSLVLVPLAVEGTVIKLFIIAQRHAQGFSSPDCEFLRQLGEHVALAVHQFKLHSALQEAYDGLARSQQSMIQQERLRVLGQMASGIAHDINNAIAPATIYAEWILERDTALAPDTRRRMATIRRALDDVTHTVARLREFYRGDDPHAAPAEVDLNLVAAEVIDLTRARWSDLPQQQGKVIRMETALAAGLPNVRGIAPELREALINLVFNAVDAMPEGGTMTISTHCDPDMVAITVADTGIGMDAETRRRCLEPFFTTKGSRGTGIGLAMVYGITQRHHARIEIDSAPGAGTAMRIVFPRHPVAVAETPAAPTAAPAPTRRLRILVVDDDARVLATLVDILGQMGHDVTSADGGEAGINAFHAALAAGQAPQVVFTDLGMPHVDGRAVAIAIKKAVPGTPVMLLTGWGQRLVADLIPPEVDQVLDKPPTIQRLRQVLAQVPT